MSATEQEIRELPRDNLVRGVFLDETRPELRDDTGNGAMPTLTGRFAVFNEWTEINSFFEGNFMERIAPSAFRKTVAENVSSMRVLFQHGRDPQVGNKPLGPIASLDEKARYEVPLLDTSYNRDLLPGLKAGVYGASFRFQVMKEEMRNDPGVSDYNPKGLPERTITEARVMEFGPVTFPAYAGATAGVRSLTDEFLGNQARDETQDVEPEHSPQGSRTTPEDTEPEHSQEGSRTTPEQEQKQEPSTLEAEDMTVTEMRSRLEEIEKELREIAAENQARVLEPDVQARWDALTKEHDDVEKAIAADEARSAYLENLNRDDRNKERGSQEATVYVTKRDGRDKAPDDPFALTEYTSRATSQDHMIRLYTEGARKALDQFEYPHERARREDVSEHLERLLRADGLDREIAQRFIVMGSPTYRSAFWKTLMRMPLNAAEQSAMVAATMLEARSVLTANTGGVTVPIQIDPTLIPVSNGVLNPFRSVARNVTTTSYIWQGVTQAGVTFTYRAEGATMADNAPTLVARPIQPERADAFIPFSWEVGQDWGSLEVQLAEAIQDGKDAAEATQFAVGAGHGSNAPQGVLVGAGTVVGSSGNTALAVGDVYALEAALPPRYQANATWLMTNATGQRVRQLVAAAGPAQWGDSLAVGQPERLLGHPIYKASTVGTAGSNLTSSARWAIIGDFSRYVIVDRIGLSIRMIDNVFAGNTAGGLSYPVGMSGVVAFYRNSAGVVDSNAFRVGTIT